MRMRSIGKSGLRVSVVGLGTVAFGDRVDLEQARQVVDAALDAGINFIDTADAYGKGGRAEEILGQVLQGHRDDVVLATKFGANMGNRYGKDFGARASRRYIVRAVEGSLRRLRTDYVDLYQLHMPDNITPMEETLTVLDDLVRAGKVRYIGSSHLAPWQVVEADWLARDRRLTRFICAQDHYSLLNRAIEAEFVPACLAHDVATLPFHPLATGLLTGRWKRGEQLPPGSRMLQCQSLGLATDETANVIEQLTTFATERGVSLIDVAIGGLAAQPGVASVIAGATTSEQVRRNASASDFIPSGPDLVEINRIAPTRRPQGGPPPRPGAVAPNAAQKPVEPTPATQTPAEPQRI